MSFQERSTWILGVIMLVVYGWYFTTVFAGIDDPAMTAVGYKGMMVATVIVLVILAVVTHIIIAIADPKGADQNDERDREINRYGEYVGGYVLAVGAVIAMGMAMLEMDSFWVANAILAGLVLSELVSAGVKIVLYRRGI